MRAGDDGPIRQPPDRLNGEWGEESMDAASRSGFGALSKHLFMR